MYMWKIPSDPGLPTAYFKYGSGIVQFLICFLVFTSGVSHDRCINFDSLNNFLMPIRRLKYQLHVLIFQPPDRH